MTAFFQVPVLTGPERPSTIQRTALDGRTYVLELDWSAREERWFFAISDAAGNPIRLGKRVVVGTDLLAHVVSDARPPGMLLVVSLDGSNASPGLVDLGSRVQLIYATEATS
jgi:hypothetical protein